MKEQITLYITHNQKTAIVDPLIKDSKQFPNIVVVGAGPQNENSLKEISLSKPDVVIAGTLSAKDAAILLDLTPESKLIMLITDDNRAAETSRQLEKEGYTNHTFFNLNNVAPMEVLDFIATETDKTDDNLAKSEDVMTKAFENPSVVEVDSTEEVEGDLVEDVETISVIDRDLDGLKRSQEAVVKFDDKGRVNLVNLKTKIITVHGKKGGTGKTVIAKEIANLYSNIKLPKKLNLSNSYLKVCLVDFDFEKGSIRTHLGIENPVPNIYMWIDDILEKIENGIPVERINYSKMQVLSRFVKKVDREFFVLPTDQGGIPHRILNKIQALDKNGTLFKRITEIILASLRGTFDIVVVDTPSSIDEGVVSAMEISDNILLVFNPSISNAENYKTLLDDLTKFETIDPDKLAVVVNKRIKKPGLIDNFEDMLSLVKFETFSYEENRKVSKIVPIIANINYEEIVIQAENNFMFVTEMNPTHFKRDIIKICEYILPIFKIKATRSAANAKLTKNGLRKKKKEKRNKKANTKQEIINEMKGDTSTKETKVEDTKTEEQELTPEETKIYENVSEFLNEELSIDNYDTFIKKLKNINGIKKLPNGFPLIEVKPKTLKKRVWKRYLKASVQEIKAYKRSLRQKND